MFLSLLNARILAQKFAYTSCDIVSSKCNYENLSSTRPRPFGISVVNVVAM